MKSHTWRRYGFLLLLVLCGLGRTVALSSETTISSDGAIESVRPGDPASKIFATFKSHYRITDETKPGSARTLTLTVGDRPVVCFSIDGDSRIFLIDVSDVYRTMENIGNGSTLAEVRHVYGKGSVTPTDQGYLVSFPKLKHIAFLLRNEDIPSNLRDIPDDVFTPRQERRILSIGNARVVGIQISN
jgi:hypothetical protein